MLAVVAPEAVTAVAVEVLAEMAELVEEEAVYTMGIRTRNRASKSEDDNNKETDHTVDGVRKPSSSSEEKEEEEQQGRNTKVDDTAAPDAKTEEDLDCHGDDALVMEIVVAAAAADKNNTAAAGPMDRAVAAAAAAAASVASADMRWWRRGRCVLRSSLSEPYRILPCVDQPKFCVNVPSNNLSKLVTRGPPITLFRKKRGVCGAK